MNMSKNNNIDNLNMFHVLKMNFKSKSKNRNDWDNDRIYLAVSLPFSVVRQQSVKIPGGNPAHH